MTHFRFWTIPVCLLLAACSGCKSYWIEADIENQTGRAIRELEVDYPTASFGTNALAPGTTLHYRFQIRGGGPVKVQYSFEDGKTTQAQGLMLSEHERGGLVIRLLPQGKVEFLPNLQPAS